MSGQGQVLFTPSTELVVTSNAWAFLHWLRTTRGTDLADWAALQRFSVEQREACGAAVREFARLPAAPVLPMAELLLHTDVRPDDRLLVAGGAHQPWLLARHLGAKVTIADASPATLLATTAETSASILVASAQSLAEAAFQRPRQRPNLAALRIIIATGGPLSPEARRRVYTWIKADMQLLARTGDTFWGNPLEPVYDRPSATPAFAMPRPSNPATR